MARKRGKSKAPRRSRPANRRAKLSGALRVADNLVGVSVWYMFLTSLILLISVQASPSYTLSNLSSYGWDLTKGNLSMLSIAWILLAGFTGFSNKFARASGQRRHVFGLFLLGVLAAFLGRPEAAALTVIASIIYFAKSRGN